LSDASEQSWKIRPERPEDAPLVEALNEAAFGPGRFAKAAYRLREGVSQVAELSFVAVEGRQFRGSVRFWPVVIGAHDHHSAMGIALNSVQRDALALDPAGGLRLARKIAMLTYKSEELFKQRHDRRPDRRGRPRFDVEGYLEHQADLFERRMDPASYVTLTHAMDAFDARDARPAAGSQPKLAFVGISSDWLFRPDDVRAASERLAQRGFDTTYLQLESAHGHDAFLAEPAALATLLRPLFKAAST